MSLIKKVSITILSGLFILLTGCAATPYNYAALEEAKPRSIVVIPPQNSTVEVNAPYIFLSTISKPLAEKGYYVYPVSVIENFLKENGMPTTAEMNTVSLDKIREHIGADAALYINIEDWGQQYNVLSSTATVNYSLRLIDTRTGKLLWDAHASAVHQPDNSGGGLAGLLIGAIVNQIAGSIVDMTPDLSREANNKALNAKARGLLNGPYLTPSTSVAQQ